MTESAPSRRYFWDFFGPRARGTAEHFARHLDQDLAANGVTGCAVSVEDGDPGHVAVVCATPMEHYVAIERAFRPQRAL